MSHRSIWLLVLAAQLAGPAGCSNEPPAVVQSVSALEAPEATVPVPPGCFSKVVQQPAESGKKVDILIVADTSTSMNNEQDAVADALAQFVSGIDRQGDYHIGLLPAHGSLGPSAGRLWKGEIDVCPTCPVISPADAGEDLAEKFRDLRRDPRGSDPASDGGEMGMYSLLRMVTEPNAAGNAGFFRPEAALAVIFLSDENDICAYGPLGSRDETTAPDYHKFDPELREREEFDRTCLRVKPDGSNVLGEIHGLKGDRPVFVGGIIYAPSDYPPLQDPTAEDEVGYGFREMIALAGGSSVDLALAKTDLTEFKTAIGKLGEAVGRQVELIRQVELEQPPTGSIDPASIRQYNLPDPTPVPPVPSDFDPGTRRVTLHDPGTFGSLVQINYCPRVDACQEGVDFCLENSGPNPCPKRGLYRKPLQTGGTPFTWAGHANCSVCKLNVERFDVPNNKWVLVPGAQVQVSKNTSVSFKFGVAGARFDETTYKFSFHPFASGENGPPPVPVCFFDVFRP